MGTRRWFVGRSAATLGIVGGIAAGRGAVVSAQQDSATTTPAAGTTGQGEPVLGTPIFEPAIDLIRAQEIALEGNDGAVVRKVELEGDDGLLHYEVTLDNGVEVEIDATSGEVLRTDRDDDDDNDDDDDDDHDDDNDDDDHDD
jgi:uncharacterized membrane protein YkoI